MESKLTVNHFNKIVSTFKESKFSGVAHGASLFFIRNLVMSLGADPDKINDFNLRYRCVTLPNEVIRESYPGFDSYTIYTMDPYEFCTQIWDEIEVQLKN